MNDKEKRQSHWVKVLVLIHKAFRDRPDSIEFIKPLRETTLKF